MYVHKSFFTYTLHGACHHHSPFKLSHPLMINNLCYLISAFSYFTSLLVYQIVFYELPFSMHLLMGNLIIWWCNNLLNLIYRHTSYCFQGPFSRCPAYFSVWWKLRIRDPRSTQYPIWRRSYYHHSNSSTCDILWSWSYSERNRKETLGQVVECDTRLSNFFLNLLRLFYLFFARSAYFIIHLKLHIFLLNTFIEWKMHSDITATVHFLITLYEQFVIYDMHRLSSDGASLNACPMS